MSQPPQKGFGAKIRSFFQGTDRPEELSRDELEALLFKSDLSVEMIQELLKDVDRKRKKGKDVVLQTLFDKTQEALAPVCEKDFEVQAPSVVLLLGINGSGKTTSAARLGAYLKSQGHKVMFAAGDTYRAGAIDQLQTWAERLDVECIAGDYKSDPAAVIYQAWQKAKQENAILIADTAGRLHTQVPLMEQLKKIERVLHKDEDVKMTSLLVLDGTNGQNALMQSKHFASEVNIDGIVMTKLDGSSKGGAVISSAIELDRPIYFVGIGEKESDFLPFDVDSFLHSFYGI